MGVARRERCHTNRLLGRGVRSHAAVRPRPRANDDRDVHPDERGAGVTGRRRHHHAYQHERGEPHGRAIPTHNGCGFAARREGARHGDGKENIGPAQSWQRMKHQRIDGDNQQHQPEIGTHGSTPSASRRNAAAILRDGTPAVRSSAVTSLSRRSRRSA